VNSVLNFLIVYLRRTGLSAARDEAVPALKLQNRRRLLGYLVPLINLPLLLVKAQEIYTSASSGLQWNTPEFLNDIFLLLLGLGVVLLLPSFAPVYASSYALTGTGLKISRFMKRKVTLPYPGIERIELHLRDEKRGEPSQEALKYSRDSINQLRKAGFKFADYTNDEANVTLLFSENKVYMISPAYPKVFANKLRKRIGRLPVRIVHLTPRGKRIQDQAS
jgi:hypothetical protein